MKAEKGTMKKKDALEGATKSTDTFPHVLGSNYITCHKATLKEQTNYQGKAKARRMIELSRALAATQHLQQERLFKQLGLSRGN